MITMTPRDCLRRCYCCAASFLILCISSLHGGQADSWDTIRALAAKRVAGKSYVQVFSFEGPQVDLYSCGASNRITGLPEGDDPYSDVTDLVVWLELISKDIQSRGISAAAGPYLQRLQNYGRQQLARIDAGGQRAAEPWPGVHEATLKGLARALNSSLGRQVYIVEGGCGAGEVPVRFRVPSGSRASIINTFRYELCAVRNVDPQNTNACYGWKPVTGVAMYLSGSYRYLLARSDGRVSSGAFVIDQVQIGSAFGEDRPYVVDLR